MQKVVEELERLEALQKSKVEASNEDVEGIEKELIEFKRKLACERSVLDNFGKAIKTLKDVHLTVHLPSDYLKVLGEPMKEPESILEDVELSTIEPPVDTAPEPDTAYNIIVNGEEKQWPNGDINYGQLLIHLLNVKQIEDWVITYKNGLKHGNLYPNSVYVTVADGMEFFATKDDQ